MRAKDFRACTHKSAGVDAGMRRPLSARKRTLEARTCMSAKCHKRTSHAWQSANHLVGLVEQKRRDVDAERVGGLEVDDELNFVGCSTGSSPGFSPFKILSTYTVARRTISRVSGPYEKRVPGTRTSRMKTAAGKRFLSANWPMTSRCE
jgi:hypothetical protein